MGTQLPRPVLPAPLQTAPSGGRALQEQEQEQEVEITFISLCVGFPWGHAWKWALGSRMDIQPLSRPRWADVCFSSCIFIAFGEEGRGGETWMRESWAGCLRVLGTYFHGVFRRGPPRGLAVRQRFQQGVARPGGVLRG